MKEKLIFWIVFLISFFQSHHGIGQDFKTIGYLPTYRFNTINAIELEKITHLNISFANPDANGNLQTNGVSINSVVQQAHDAGVEVFIALAGAGAPLADWEDWITPNNRSSFISGIVDYVVQHDLQGVDVDLEWGTVNSDYSGFVLELKDSLNQHNLSMSAALPGTYRYPEITAEALASFDWVNLMAYDLTGPWQPNNPGPHSPYSFATNSIDYWVNQGLEKNRMTLGVPFYGYDFTDQSNVTAVTFAGIVNLDPANAQLDQVGEIYYNGLPTIEQKTTLALNELSGIMIWELGQDHFGEFSLLQKIDETINEFIISTIFNADDSNNTVVYPNPVSDFASIKIDIPNDFKITLFSSALQILKTQQSYYQDEIQINMRNYPKGLYFISIENDGFVKTLKLIKK